MAQLTALTRSPVALQRSRGHCNTGHKPASTATCWLHAAAVPLHAPARSSCWQQSTASRNLLGGHSAGGTVPHGLQHHGAAPAARSVSAAAGRHPDYADPAARDAQPKAAPRQAIEADDKYARVDSSEVHAWEARRAFASAIAGGEAAARVGEAALWVSAEDDAIASHSTVPFPVASYLARINAIAADVRARLDSSKVTQAGAAAEPAAVLRAVEAVLFTGQHAQEPAAAAPVLGMSFRAPPHGRSNLPRNAVVDHAGTWEDARDAYLHEVLVRRRGHPAALAILYSEVMARLLVQGVVEFVTAMDFQGFSGLPRGVVLPGITRTSLTSSSSTTGSGGSTGGSGTGSSSSSSSSTLHLNTCSTDALVELQRHLKRAYWPWAWDNSDALDAVSGPGGAASHGGFRAAAKAGLGDDTSAAIRAVSTVAAWRLERGIWTSPGAGDLRRAVCACERLVMLRGDVVPDERRDLVVALMHAGALGAARAELRAYMDTAHFHTAADPFDKALCYKLMELLASAGDSVTEPHEVTSVQTALNAPPPGPSSIRKPLTW